MAELHEHVETKAQKRKRLRGELKLRREKRGNLLRRARAHAKRIKVVRKAIARLKTPAVPGHKNGWHPHAIRNQVQAGIGAFRTGPAKGVLHTTEGTSLPGYQGSHPHFTLDVKRRLMYQHIPVTSGAMALQNDAGGIETNRDHAIQVELIGFAAQTQDWSDGDYAFVAEWMRWAEKNCGIARKCTVEFVGRDVSRRLGSAAWDNYSGWLGHQHVPENDHWDPGRFQIQKVL